MLKRFATFDNQKPCPDAIAKLFGDKAKSKSDSVTDARLILVGTRYYFPSDTDLRDFLDHTSGRKMIMAAEPDNEFDHNAVAVYDDYNSDPRIVCHVVKEDIRKAKAIIDLIGTGYADLLVQGTISENATSLVAYPMKNGKVMKTIPTSLVNSVTVTKSMPTEVQPVPDLMDWAKYTVSNGTKEEKHALASLISKALARYPARFTPIAVYLESAKNAYKRPPCTLLNNKALALSGQGKSLSRAVVRLTNYINDNKDTMFWSYVYYFMVRHKMIGEFTSAKQFGELIESHGGPSAQTVRKSGNYQLSSFEERKLSKTIESLSAFFSDN